jgi:2-dehydro-3-deoxyphosphogluconate aldolase/(4S)-4-hydroxy-2-oxoglutarate aldolase
VTPEAVLDRLFERRVVAVLRASSAEHLPAVAEVLVESGVDAVEVTLTTPGAVDALHDLAERLGDAALVGAGTVLDEQQAVETIAAGARFLISPIVDQAVLRTGLAASVPVFPAALTPTEFALALRAGAGLVKLFPASTVGPAYLRALRGPFPDLRAMPTGGVSIESVPDWLAAGAAVVGLGGPLIGDSIAGGSLEELGRRARRLVELADRNAGG